ncbi:phage tail tape measure protein [Brevundimonas phoenicis]|uniref:phage tail tape measure protein n=2 Tax=Pseudomonadota TaxID=1224 RepID=UPI0039AF69DE
MSSALIGALRVFMGLDSASFHDGLSEAQVAMKKAGEQMQRVGKQMSKVGQTLTTHVTAPITAAFASVAASVVMVSKEVAELAAEAKTAGVSFEAFQQLKYAAERSQVSVEALTDGLKEMQLRADEFAVTGKGSAAEAFERIGYSATQAKEALKDPALMFEDIIDRISKLDKAAQIRVADEIFGGTGGEQFVRMMDGGIEGIRALKAEFVANGGLIPDATAKQALDFQNAMKGLGDAAKGVVMAIAGSGLLETFTGLMNKAAEWVRGLSSVNPEIVKWGVVLAGVAAAIGPVLMAVGAVASGIGALMPVLGAIAAVMSGPVVLAVGAAVLAFMAFKDDIIPALKSFGAVLKETVGPKIAPLMEAAKSLFSAFGSVVSGLFSANGGSLQKDLKMWGEVIARVFGAALDIITGAVRVITSVLNAIGAALRGDWSAMWGHLGSAVMSALKGIGNAFATLFPEITAWVRKTYEGVKTWLMTKLGETLGWVIGKVQDVGQAFFKLYDAVVGHSYVPDMVTEVGQWMARLDDNMVKPARRSTEAAAKAFEDMRDRVARVMEGLMTDREKLDLGFRRDIKTLDDGLAKKVISQQEYDQAVSRARRDYTTNSAGLDAEGLTLPKTPDLSGPFPGVDRINAAWDSMKEADARMREAIFNSREAFANSFAWGAEQAMRGDWKGLLQTVVGDVFSNALKDLGRSLFDMKGGGGFSFGNILSSISKFLPGFKNGGSFTVGGSGGADSKIAMMRVSPRERVDVSTVRQQRRGDGQGLIISVDKSDYFDVAVRRVSAPDAASAGIASFQASESQRQRAVRIAPYRRG